MVDCRSPNQMKSVSILCDMDGRANISIDDGYAHFEARIFDSDDEYFIEAMIDPEGMVTDYKIRGFSQSLRTENMESEDSVERREEVRNAVRQNMESGLEASRVSVDNVFVGDISSDFIVQPENNSRIKPDELKELVDAVRRGVSEF